MAKTKTPSKRASKASADKKITVLVDENPKRKGTESFKRFAIYKTGMLVKTFLEKGGTAADLSHDVKHKYISLS